MRARPTTSGLFRMNLSSSILSPDILRVDQYIICCFQIVIYRNKKEVLTFELNLFKTNSRLIQD